MAPPPSDEYWQANFRQSGSAYPTGAEYTVQGRNPTNLSMATVASALFTAWQSNLRPITPTAVNLDDILLKFGPPDIGPQAAFSVGNAGTGSGGDVTPSVCLLVQKRSSLGGRRNRGRLYFPLAEADCDQGGAVDPTFLSTAAGAFATFFSDIATADLPLYVFHTNILLAPTPLTGLEVQGQAATQRRRLRR